VYATQQVRQRFAIVVNTISNGKVLIRESIIFNTSADIHVRNNLKNFKFKRPAEDKYLQLSNSLIKIKLYSKYVIYV
jgi:hypothetical protein